MRKKLKADEKKAYDAIKSERLNIGKGETEFTVDGVKFKADGHYHRIYDENFPCSEALEDGEVYGVKFEKGWRACYN